MLRAAYQIIVADKSNNVRDFLRREFIAAGYRVLTVKDGFDLINTLRGSERTDLVIMDLDLPFVSGFVTEELIRYQKAGLPIILHGVPDLDAIHPLADSAVAMVEKTGNPQLLEAKMTEILMSRGDVLGPVFTESQDRADIEDQNRSK